MSTISSIISQSLFAQLKIWACWD